MQPLHHRHRHPLLSRPVVRSTLASAVAVVSSRRRHRCPVRPVVHLLPCLLLHPHLHQVPGIRSRSRRGFPAKQIRRRVLFQDLGAIVQAAVSVVRTGWDWWARSRAHAVAPCTSPRSPVRSGVRAGSSIRSTRQTVTVSGTWWVREWTARTRDHRLRSECASIGWTWRMTSTAGTTTWT